MTFCIVGTSKSLHVPQHPSDGAWAQPREFLGTHGQAHRVVVPHRVMTVGRRFQTHRKNQLRQSWPPGPSMPSTAGPIAASSYIRDQPISVSKTQLPLTSHPTNEPPLEGVDVPGLIDYHVHSRDNFAIGKPSFCGKQSADALLPNVSTVSSDAIAPARQGVPQFCDNMNVKPKLRSLVTESKYSVENNEKSERSVKESPSKAKPKKVPHNKRRNSLTRKKGSGPVKEHSPVTPIRCRRQDDLADYAQNTLAGSAVPQVLSEPCDHHSDVVGEDGDEAEKVQSMDIDDQPLAASKSRNAHTRPPSAKKTKRKSLFKAVKSAVSKVVSTAIAKARHVSSEEEQLKAQARVAEWNLKQAEKKKSEQPLKSVAVVKSEEELLDEQKKAKQRIEEHKRQEREKKKNADAQDEVLEERRRRLEAREQRLNAKERRRAEIYALNAIMKRVETAKMELYRESVEDQSRTQNCEE